MFDQHPAPSPAGNNVNTMPEENNSNATSSELFLLIIFQ